MAKVSVRLTNGETVSRDAFEISSADLPERRIFVDGEWRTSSPKTRKQYAVVLGYNEAVYDMSGNAVTGIAYIQTETDTPAAPQEETADAQSAKRK